MSVEDELGAIVPGCVLYCICILALAVPFIRIQKEGREQRVNFYSWRASSPAGCISGNTNRDSAAAGSPASF